MPFELILAPAGVTVTPSTAAESQAPGGPIVVDPTLVDRQNDYLVNLNWSTNGPLFASWVSPLAVWTAEVIFEQMGVGEYAGGPHIQSTPHVPNPGPTPYAVTITIPGTLAVGGTSLPVGIYRVIVKLFFDPTGAGIPVSACGFEDLGFVQFYN